MKILLEKIKKLEQLEKAADEAESRWTEQPESEELENELTKVCGTYENDCSKCPKQKECEEYCKLAQIYEIVNR